MNRLIDTEQLKAVTGYTRPGDIERCLRKNGIVFCMGRNGPFTTIDALNTAMGIQPSLLKPNEPEFEFL